MKKAMGLLVVLLVLSLGVACGTSKPPPTAGDELEGLRTEIHKRVADEDRAAVMLADVDRMNGALEELGALVERHGDELRVQVRNYDTSRQELESLLERHLTERGKVVDLIAEAHFELKAAATTEEWKHLAKKEKKALTWAAMRHLGELPLSTGSEGGA